MFKKLKAYIQISLLPEILFLSTVIIMFDMFFVVRFNFNILFTYWLIALLNVAFFVGLLALIKSNKKRFRAHMIYLFSMFVLFVSNSTLYYFKNDISSVATLVEMFKSSMRVGLKYNPFTAYQLLEWFGIGVFVFVAVYILRKIVFMHNDQNNQKTHRIKYFVMIAALAIFAAPRLIREEDVNAYQTPQDKTLFIQKFGSLTFYARDIVVYASTMVDPILRGDDYKLFLDEEIVLNEAEQSALFGSHQNKNVIMIMCETCENYAFDRELTPNYFRLYDQSLVYTNAFSAAKRNYTYDAEFKALTSMMYSGLDNYMYTFGRNTYNNALPNILKEQGYSTRSFHNYYGTFFNRDIIHPNMGFEHYYAMEQLEIEPTDYWPLDSWMFEQWMDLIVPIQENPFFSFILTVTPHGPHDHYREELSVYYELIEAHGVYSEHEQAFKTLMAAQMNFDKGLGMLLDHLEATNLIDETIIVFFSDHKNYSTLDITEKYKLDSEIPYMIEKIPFMIYSSQFEHELLDVYTSHYDVTPTLLDLLGIRYYEAFYYGQPLFLETRMDKPIILTHSRWLLPDHAVMDDEIVLGELDPEAFLEMKAYITYQFELFEAMFKSDYFLTQQTHILIE